jgi:hypothetical protein
MNRLIGHQEDPFGGPAHPVWSAGRPPKPKAEPKARKSDPETSKAAALAAKDLAERHSSMIFRCLADNGPAGKDAIAARTKLTGVQVGRRLKELAAERVIKVTGRRVASVSGRYEREWEVV